ncbi:MAG: hypothetical protein LBG52_01410 [Candidatus Peribacteria bacterium]|jgi:hypothetical protein|nr:hypothetical protein [Candidatus Peribacteria bacterium]
MGHMRPHFHFTTVDASYIDYQRKKATITFSNHGKNPSIYDDILLDASSPIFSDFDGEKAKKADIILMYQKDDNYVKFMEHYKVNLLLAEKKRYEIIIQDKNRLTAENQKFIDTYKDKLITNGDNIQEVRKDDFFVQLFQYLEKH